MSGEVRETRLGVGEDGVEALRGVRVAVVVSRYNGWVTDRLELGAIEAFGRLGGGEVVVVGVCGALELPCVVSGAVEAGFDAVVALGCVIKGETSHDAYVSGSVIGALTELSVRSRVPIGVGVLTVDNAEQAESRAGGAHGNKGAEAMEAALASVSALRGLAVLCGERKTGAGVSDG